MSVCSSGASWGQVTWFSLHPDNTEVELGGEGERGGGGEEKREGEEGREGEGERAGEGEGLREGEGGNEAEREDIKAAFQSVLEAQATGSTRHNTNSASLTSSVHVTAQALKRKANVSTSEVDSSVMCSHPIP